MSRMERTNRGAANAAAIRTASLSRYRSAKCSELTPQNLLSAKHPGNQNRWLQILVRPGFPGVGFLESAMLLSHQDTGGQHGKTRLHRGVRQRVLDLVMAGRRVEEIAHDLGISDQTVYSWRRQDRVDRGLESGLTTAERAELISARRRIRELETELAVHRRAAELLKGASTPKGSRQSR